MRKLFLTPKEIAQLTGLSERTIKGYFYNGELHGIKPHNWKILIPVSEFEQFFKIKLPDDCKITGR
ncbi:DNA-binding protein [Biomaibacter acetigenes]|uniref:DNA-binding protein n=1 Tax=Biomaibacter acetigenes TaxID=2316383 RepID=A0A3G2R640_9FIRM|nr:helix-turn-helix domain-containing protein [Biomaibacter acetigenes]AYO30871.1 DNA-binding protein [Biomaibacter acetigenes]